MLSVPSLLTSRQLGRLPSIPRTLFDRALVAPLLCTADDDYLSIAPDLETPHLNPEPPTYAMAFCPVQGSHHLLCLANEDGAIHVQDTSKVTPKLPLAPRRCHENAIFAFCWAGRDAARLVTASGDQSVCAWDLGVEGPAVRRLRGHTRSVKTVEWRPGSDHELASAGRDNTVMVWDLRSPGDETPENAIRSAHSLGGSSGSSSRKRLGSGAERGAACSVTGLCWLDSNCLASVGDSDGRVKLWDLRKHYSLYKGDPLPREELLHPGTSSNTGFTTLSTDPTSSYLYVSCMDSNIYQYNAVTALPQPTAVFTGASIKNFFIKHSLSVCGRYLASGSTDHSCYLWHTASPGGPVARLGPQEAEVTCVSWRRGQEGLLLAAASDDMRHRLWRGSRVRVEQEEVRGRAEMLGKVDLPPVFVSPPRRSNELVASSRTPQRGTPSSRRGGSTPSITSFLTPRQSRRDGGTPLKTPVNDVKRGLKRRAVDFNDENCEPVAKEVRTELSSSISSLLQSPSSRCSFSPSSYRSPTKASPRLLASPLRALPLTPARANLSSSLSCHPSPTANLPNLVTDGSSPRALPSLRPAARTRNWLTELASRRQEQCAKTGEGKKKGSSKSVVKKIVKKI